jgi:hypothetical protein
MHLVPPTYESDHKKNISVILAEGVGEDDQGDHDDGQGNNGYLQVLLEESAELNGTQALLLEDRRTVFVMAMVMVMFLFHIT